ncbi:MAG: glutaredoxin family protein [Archaeoglobaceae archaeon]
MNHVPGEYNGHIKLYADSSCEWCKKTMRLLKDLEVDFWYIFVDQVLEENEKRDTMDFLEMYNPACTLPTIVINEECIVGYDEQEIKEKLGKSES